MLDRERSHSTTSAGGGHSSKDKGPVGSFIETKPGTREQRTTIVPQAFEDLDSEPTRTHTAPRKLGQGDFELDDPDIFDADLDEPTLIDHDSNSNATRREMFVAGTRSKAAQRRVEPNNSTRPILPKPPAQLPATQRPLTQPPRAAVVAPKKTSHPPSEDPKSEKWYLRVQLNTECVADLWVRDLTPHNVLVWHEDMATWVPLLTVRELRDAIRDAHDVKTRDQLRESNFVFIHTSRQGGDHAPLPKPRLPAAMESVPAAPPTSHWSQPKPRTISNVPPPLLTTSVPVVGAIQSQLANARRNGSASTVPPVVTSIGQTPELPLDGDWVPQIPRPSRVPAVKPYWADAEPVEIDAIALDSDPFSSPKVAPRPMLLPTATAAAAQAAIQRIPTDRTLAVTRPVTPPPAKSPAQNLVHLERILWLAAGIAVASATMLILRDPGRGSIATVAPQPAAARNGETMLSDQKTSGSTDTSAAKSATRSGSHSEEVHHLEDLPLVSGSKSVAAAVAPVTLTAATAPAAPATKGTKAAKTATKGRVSQAVTPESLTLASSTPANPGGAAAFDTNAARRVLTSSASRAGRCAAEGPASGSVLVTFAPTGFVQSASMSGMTGQGVNVGCVLRAFQEARVSPFAGTAITVRKGFQIP